MSLLAIPDPATVDLDRARDLAASVVAWAEECDDLAALEDARAKVAAIETYLRRRGEAVAAEIAAADRRLEVRIGSLLGPSAGHGGARQPGPSPHADLPRQRANEFRRIAEHQDDPAVAAAINNGASRRQVLEEVARIRADRQAIRDLNALAPDDYDHEADVARMERIQPVFRSARTITALGDPEALTADLRDYHAHHLPDVEAAADWLAAFVAAWKDQP